jgi:SAM-dependent methyltransferase
MSSCIVCESADVRQRKGVVAPFLAQRIWDRPPFAAELVECCDCGFLYFNPRLSADEEQRLYRNYRSSEYQNARNATEPWYTGKLNASLFGHEAMQARRTAVGSILKSHLPQGALRSVLDFGGARGELIVGLIPGAQGFVYDISQLEPLPEITKVELGCGEKFELVICSNVLEHVASPRTLLEQILSFCGPGSYVFLEVPGESPLQLETRLKRVAQLAMLVPAHPALAMRLLRLGTTNVMHEHLNFYSPKALRTLLSVKPGLTAIAEGAYGHTIWILAHLQTAEKSAPGQGK